MSDNLPATVNIDHAAVLRAVNLNAADPKAQALLLICDRYGLDPLLKHVVLIQGGIYVTRDGLLAVAHRSGQLDGIVVDEQGSDQTHHVATVSVYRKDMRHPFKYVGRYPKSGGNKQYGPEMAVKCAEVMALRRAFNVSLCAREEVWDKDADHTPHVAETGEVIEVAEAQPRALPEPPAQPDAYQVWVKEQASYIVCDGIKLPGHKLHAMLGQEFCPDCDDAGKSAKLRELFATADGRIRLRTAVSKIAQVFRTPPVAPDADPTADPDVE